MVTTLSVINTCFTITNMTQYITWQNVFEYVCSAWQQQHSHQRDSRSVWSHTVSSAFYNHMVHSQVASSRQNMKMQDYFTAGRNKHVTAIWLIQSIHGLIPRKMNQVYPSICRTLYKMIKCVLLFRVCTLFPPNCISNIAYSLPDSMSIV